MAYHSDTNRFSFTPGVTQISITHGGLDTQPVGTVAPGQPGSQTSVANLIPGVRIPATRLPRLNVPANGLGLDLGINVAEVGNQIVDQVWPHVEAKVNDLAPKLIDMGLTKVRQQLPVIVNEAAKNNDVQRAASDLVSNIEAAYVEKYKPLVYFVFLAGSLWTAAALVTLYKAYKKTG